MRQDPFGDAFVVANESELREPVGPIDDPLRVTDIHVVGLSEAVAVVHSLRPMTPSRVPLWRRLIDTQRLKDAWRTRPSGVQLREPHLRHQRRLDPAGTPCRPAGAATGFGSGRPKYGTAVDFEL